MLFLAEIFLLARKISFKIMFFLLILVLFPFALYAHNITTPTTNFSKAEQYEKYPGGRSSHANKMDRKAFSHPSSNMSAERRLDFAVGRGFFKRLWVSAPSSTQAADGLGPLYNARSCMRCHVNNGRGHPPENEDDNVVSMLLRLSIPAQNDEQRTLLAEHRINIVPEPVYGAQLQDIAIQGIQPEGRLKVRYEEMAVTLSDGEVVMLRKPSYEITNLAYGPLHDQIRVSPRIAPQMIGLGLLEAIDENDIFRQADPEDKDADGISGKANLVWSKVNNEVMLGRFGWKGGFPSVNEQSQSAFFGDIGISVPLHPDGEGECTESQIACKKAPSGNSPQYENLEAHSQVSDLVVFYSSNLAVPARRDYDDERVLAGKKLFYESGCIACHTPKYVTKTLANRPEQSHQLIWPYTDLLLHDMGEGLADHRSEGQANGREWKTPPLWGIGLTQVVSGRNNFLHDGRARSLLEAILWHGGEAEASRDKVVNMNKRERENLLYFIRSL